MSTQPSSRRHTHTILIALVTLTSLLSCAIPWSRAQDGGEGPEFTDAFRPDACGFRTTGRNPYFILVPGYQLIFEGEEDGEELYVEITVLADIERIRLDDHNSVKTRVVEEREWEGGELLEISRNFFAICCETNAVYYFGEDVDIYEDGEVVSHDSAWRAGQDGARPGIMMPGTFLLGSRYYQEVAPGIAMDRGENIAMGLTIGTPAGVFEDCVEVLETTPLEPDAEGSKIYCPGVGLVVDESLELIDYGYVNLKNRDDDPEDEGD